MWSTCRARHRQYNPPFTSPPPAHPSNVSPIPYLLDGLLTGTRAIVFAELLSSKRISGFHHPMKAKAASPDITVASYSFWRRFPFSFFLSTREVGGVCIDGCCRCGVRTKDVRFGNLKRRYVEMDRTAKLHPITVVAVVPLKNVRISDKLPTNDLVFLSHSWNGWRSHEVLRKGDSS